MWNKRPQHNYYASYHSSKETTKKVQNFSSQIPIVSRQYFCCGINCFMFLCCIFVLFARERAVTHQRISETRAGRVEKKAKFLTRQTHVGNTFKTRYKRVGYAWCTSGARRCTSLKISARFARVWAKKNFKHA